MLSIVIPTLNEERFLPVLLGSIKAQTFKDYEVIVADSKSNDATRKIARQHGCKIVKGGSPAEGRNNGARAANGDLLFLDADVIIPRGFLKSFMEEIKDRKLDAASCLVWPITSKISVKMFYLLKNFNNKFFGYFLPCINGQCMFFSKGLFTRLQGFDESLFLAEEHELIGRAKKNGAKYCLLTGHHVLNSPRRLQKEGTLNLLMKNAKVDTSRIISGRVDKKIVEYEFGKF
jgi:glycosyltransferase involved in cell wall biosynthesis